MADPTPAQLAKARAAWDAANIAWNVERSADDSYEGVYVARDKAVAAIARALADEAQQAHRAGRQQGLREATERADSLAEHADGYAILETLAAQLRTLATEDV